MTPDWFKDLSPREQREQIRRWRYYRRYYRQKYGDMWQIYLALGMT